MFRSHLSSGGLDFATCRFGPLPERLSAAPDIHDQEGLSAAATSPSYPVPGLWRRGAQGRAADVDVGMAD